MVLRPLRGSGFCLLSPSSHMLLPPPPLLVFLDPWGSSWNFSPPKAPPWIARSQEIHPVPSPVLSTLLCTRSKCPHHFTPYDTLQCSVYSLPYNNNFSCSCVIKVRQKIYQPMQLLLVGLISLPLDCKARQGPSSGLFFSSTCTEQLGHLGG